MPKNPNSKSCKTAEEKRLLKNRIQRDRNICLDDVIQYSLSFITIQPEIVHVTREQGIAWLNAILGGNLSKVNTTKLDNNIRIRRTVHLNGKSISIWAHAGDPANNVEVAKKKLEEINSANKKKRKRRQQSKSKKQEVEKENFKILEQTTDGSNANQSDSVQEYPTIKLEKSTSKLLFEGFPLKCMPIQQSALPDENQPEIQIVDGKNKLGSKLLTKTDY